MSISELKIKTREEEIEDVFKRADTVLKERPWDAAVIILLDRGPNGDEYMTHLEISHLRRSEIVALLEYSKMDVFESMKGR